MQKIVFGHSYNGIFSGIQYYAYSDVELLRAFLFQILEAGKSDKIITIFTVPRLAFNSEWNGIIDNDIKATPTIQNLVSTPNNLDGYVPRNQKLRTYPYMYIGFNPVGGTPKIYRYEDFASGTPSFKFISEINPNPQVACIPQNYRGSSGDSLSDIAYITGYPTISYQSDVFNVWLAQNSQIVSLNAEQERFNYDVTGVREIGNYLGNSINNALTANIGGFISDSANTALNTYQNQGNHEFYIKQQIAQIEKQAMLPNNATLGSSNTTLLGYNLFNDNIFTRYTIKRQFAEIIDKYFDMYGYLTNKVKTPNINNRPNWNYVKLIGANIIGNIPENDLLSIKNLFENGITLWHNTNNYLDYSQNNR